MTPLPGEFSYRVLLREADFRRVYGRVRDLLWLVWPELPDEESFVARLASPGVYVLEGYVAGEAAGLLLLWPYGTPSLCAEIGVCGYRPHFAVAGALFLGALLHVLETFEPAPLSFIGRVARVNVAALTMLQAVGFRRLGVVPGMMWLARKEKFVDGVLVMATPESVKTALGRDDGIGRRGKLQRAGCGATAGEAGDQEPDGRGHGCLSESERAAEEEPGPGLVHHDPAGRIVQ